MERISYQEAPAGFFGSLQAIEDYLNNTTIELGLLALARLRAAQINGCIYCVDMHYKELVNLGETSLRLSTLCVWDEGDFFDEKEKIVLLFTEQLTKANEGQITDQLFKQLNQYFSKEEIADLTLAIAQTNTWNRLMKTFKFKAGIYQATVEA